MSTRVNLLPRGAAATRSSSQGGLVVGALLVVLVVVLGGLWYVETEALAEAEQRRDDQLATNAQLQNQIAALAEFAELQASLDARNELLAAAMAPEVSLTRTLNDLAAVFPGSSSMLTLQVQLTEDVPSPGTVTFGDGVASIAFTGYSVERVAPGVERVVVDFDRVESFFNPFLNVASGEERGDPTVVVAEFDGTVQLNVQALTRRYSDGLPEADR